MCQSHFAWNLKIPMRTRYIITISFALGLIAGITAHLGYREYQTIQRERQFIQSMLTAQQLGLGLRLLPTKPSSDEKR